MSEKLSRIERALRGSRRERPRFAVLWRVIGDDGRGLVVTPEGTFDEAYYLAELRAKGERVIVLDWRT